MIEFWALVSIACNDCGGEMATRLLDHEPTADELKENEKILGGMFCIRTTGLRLNLNDSPVVSKRD